MADEAVTDNGTDKSWIGLLRGSPWVHFVVDRPNMNEFGRFLSVVWEGNHVVVIGRPVEGSPLVLDSITYVLPRAEIARVGQWVSQSSRYVVVVLGKPSWRGEYNRTGHLVTESTLDRLSPGLLQVRWQLLLVGLSEKAKRLLGEE